jgi:ferredoxin
MRAGVLLIGASDEAAGPIVAHLARWSEAQVIRAADLAEAQAKAKRFQWTALIVASFGDEASCQHCDFGEMVHPFAFEKVSFDPDDLAHAAFVLGVKAAKLTRASIVYKAREAAPETVSSRRAIISAFAARGGKSYSNQPVCLEGKCRSPQGCNKCAEACPFEAIAAEERYPVAEDKCRRCGSCVAVCPTGAMQSPIFSDDEWFGVLDGLAASGGAIDTLIVTCAKASFGRIPAGVAVEVAPCVGALGVTHLAQAAARGPSRTIVWCPLGGTCENCVSAQRMQDDLQTLRDSLNEGRPRPIYAEGASFPEIPCAPGPAGATAAPTNEGSRRANFVANVRLAYRRGAPARANSQLHQVTVNDSCTQCGACALACADGALRLNESGNGVALEFAAESCVGCGACAEKCPEKAVTIGPCENLDDLFDGHAAVLSQAEVARCHGCGVPLGSASSLKRIASILAGNAAAVDALAYCPQCKMQRMWR